LPITVAASGDTVPRLARAEPGLLTLRILSALVLAPVAIAAVWFGTPWLAMLTAVAGAGMAWEWVRLCRSGRIGNTGAVLIAAVLVAIVVAAVASALIAIAIAATGAVIVFWVARHEHEPEPQWFALGLLWIALPCVLLLWLAGAESAGRLTLLWIFAVVWATDTGAYIVGRRIGGPLLAPHWSPRKTWAGMIGGAGCAALAGWAASRLFGVSALPLVLVSAGLAIVEQFGDLAESVAKRRFGVKDSSGLIPGHGGLLDRLDGLLAVIPAVALLTLIGGGVLTWR
jgi:phosphatidate cytidylyltransferase